MLNIEMHKEKLPYLSTRISKHSKATKLFTDFLSATEKTRGYFGPIFDDDAALAQLLSTLHKGSYPREELALALADIAADSEAPAAVSTQIDKLRNKDSSVVFAGQQPGLFTGPLYTIYKALSVERWAANLSDKYSVPVIPCFWLASDDHDFNEINHIKLPNERDIVTVEYTSKQASFGQAIDRIKLDTDIQSLTKELFDFFPASEFKQDVLGILDETYTAGLSYPLAFTRLWYRMFPQSQLVFVSPCHPQLKKLAEPVIEHALRDATHLFSIYDETSRRLENDGYHRQVHKNPAQTFVFYQHAERQNIRLDENNNFILKEEEPLTIDRLSRMLTEDPQDFSGNVLLQPLIQNTLFPTLGVVLGPSEIAYYAQIGDLHDYLDVPRPTIMPRTSVTFVQKNVSRRLSQHGIRLDALQRDVNEEIARISKTSFPEKLDNIFQLAEQNISSTFEDIQSALEQFQPGLDKTTQTAKLRVRRELQNLAKKTQAAHGRKEENTEKQIRHLALHLFPEGELQERYFNIVYYWVRYGPAFLSSLYEDWPVGCREHLIWSLD